MNDSDGWGECGFGSEITVGEVVATLLILAAIVALYWATLT